MMRPLVFSSICQGAAEASSCGRGWRPARPARCRRAAPDAAGSGRARRRPGPSRRAGRTAARYCRFQQVRRKSWSKTVMPCSIWSSAICSRSRLCCSASVASSSSRNVSLEALSPRLNSSDRMSRAEDEPTALASSCSEKRMTSMPGLLVAVQRAVLRLEGLERALGALDAEIARDRVLEVVDGDRRAEALQARHRAGVARHEDRRLDALQRHRSARQRAEHEEHQIDRQAPHDAVVERLGLGAEQRLRAQRLDAERAVDQDARVGRGKRGEEQRVGPDRDARRHAECGAPARWRRARSARRRRRARTARSRRRTSGRSRPAAHCWCSRDSRGRRRTG